MDGGFIAQHEHLSLIGPSGIGKTHLLLGVGWAVCLQGYRVLIRTAATLASELALAHQELRLPKLLTLLRRFDLVLVDELGYLPFSQTAAELLFQFFSDRYERASVAVISNLDSAHWTEVFGHERMTAALLDRLVHRWSFRSPGGSSPDAGERPGTIVQSVACFCSIEWPAFPQSITQRSDDFASPSLPRSTFDAVMREALEVRAHEIPAELDGAQVTPLSENGANAIYGVTLNGGEPIEVTISERDGQHFYQLPGVKLSHGYI